MAFNDGNYKIIWETQCIHVGLMEFPLTEKIRNSIEKSLREELQTYDFYDHFSNWIQINKCACSSSYAFIFEHNISETVNISCELEYTCYCSGYGSEGVRQYINFSIDL